MAGWAGRDPHAVAEHIRELAELGVKPPRQVPCCYQLAPALLTDAPELQVVGGASSGEVEVALLYAAGRLWVGVGSDHTDRALEAHGIAHAKQVCGKPIAPTLWPFEEVAGHWDQLILRSEIDEGNGLVPYQRGPVAALLHPMELRDRLFGGVWPEDGIVFGGTLPTIGGIRPARHFAFALEDPVLGRTIRHAHDIAPLPCEDDIACS
jgi:hypothetical protein